MKKSLIILLATLALAPIANCGINFGGIPGNFTLDSLGPGNLPQSSRETAHTARRPERAVAVAGGVDPGKRKARLSAGRGQRPRLQPPT